MIFTSAGIVHAGYLFVTDTLNINFYGIIFTEVPGLLIPHRSLPKNLGCTTSVGQDSDFQLSVIVNNDNSQGSTCKYQYR